MAKDKRSLLYEWISTSQTSAVDTIILMAAQLNQQQRTALVTRIRDDLKSVYSDRRNQYVDSDADSLDLD